MVRHDLEIRVTSLSPQKEWEVMMTQEQSESPDFNLRMKVLVAQSCPTLCNPMDCGLPGSSVHGNLLATTGVGCHFLLQGIFPTQRSNPGLHALQADSLPSEPLVQESLSIKTLIPWQSGWFGPGAGET